MAAPPAAESGPATMRAVQIDSYGGPDVLRWRTTEIPAPASDEVLVRIAFSGVNFMDVHTRQGKYARSRNYTTALPLTLGIEGSGWVEATGSEVSQWRPGDRVAWCLSRGSYAEFAVVPAWRLVQVPERLSLELAAASLFHGMTAHYLAHDTGRLEKGMSCLVHSGAGGIGQILIQLAKSLGVRVIATTSTADKAHVARRRGADLVTSYAPEDFIEAAMQVTNGTGVDVVFDAIGPATLAADMQAICRRGLLVSFGSNSGPYAPIDPMTLAEAGSLFFTRPRLADHIPDAQSVRRRGEAIFMALVDGSLTVEVDQVYSLATVAEGLSALEERRAIGKSILRLIEAAPR
jgi:NADPH:quinone reductase